ncbi:MAG: hypothetical protein WCO55_00050 [Candidatus Falkowbacteria bacterium]
MLTNLKKKRLVAILLATTIYNFSVAPALHQAQAAEESDATSTLISSSTMNIATMVAHAKELQIALESNTEPVATEQQPEIKRIKVSSAKRSVSAYNVGDPYQTDADACTTANGENACLALELGYSRCAANFVPFGTILNIEGYGECMVTDRMNTRYPTSVDIAMKKEDKAKAMQWGRRTVTVEIIKYQETVANSTIPTQ